MNDYLFTYGTLRRRFKPRLLNRYADYVGLGRFQGRLYEVGGFPGAIPSDRAADLVIGDVYKLPDPDRLLPQLDQYEHYLPDQPDRSLYLRKKAPIILDGRETIRAWIYLYNRSVAGLAYLPLGDYLQYID